MPSESVAQSRFAALVGRHGWSAAVFAMFALLLGTWVVGVPRYGAPDEVAHTIKAYGTAHGETIGVPIPGSSALTRAIRAPWVLATGDPGCFAFFPTVTAECSYTVDDTTITPIGTQAATYPPLYYAAVGGITRLTTADTSVRTYRTVSALLVSAILAAAFTIARRLAQNRAPLVMLALTPMAVFMFAAVNPTSIEIAGSLLLWIYFAALALQPTLATRRQLVIASSIGGIVIATRPVALPWIAIACACYLLVERRRLLADRRGSLRLIAYGSVPLVVASVLSFAWSKYAGVTLADDKYVTTDSVITVFRTGLGRTSWMFDQAIGILGWLDTELPLLVIALSVIGLVLLVATVLFHGSRLLLALVAGMIAVWVLYPAIYVTVARTPLVWQGRYNLPLLGGFVFCALLVSRTDAGRQALTRLSFFAAPAFVVLEVLAFHQMLRRFMVGAEGDILLRHRSWSPSIDPWLLIAANALVSVGLAVAVLRPPRADPSLVVALGDPTPQGSGYAATTVVAE